MKFELTLEIKNATEEIGKRYGLKFIILHGSYAKGTQGPGSDLDIAVLGKHRIDGEEYLKIFGELEDVFGNNRERELDFKTLHNIDPLFRYQVIKDGVLLFGDPREYEEFRLYAYRDYEDSYDLRQLELHLLKKSIRATLKQYA